MNEKIATAFDVKLTNMITGRDKQSGVEAIDAIEKEMEGYKFPSKPRLKMFAEIARAQRGYREVVDNLREESSADRT